jgi:Xaa-Pro aminopeptidase
VQTHLSPFAERRASLARALQAAGGGLAIVPTAPERVRNADSDHPYRHDSDFHHLTGFDEPGAWLLVDSSGRSTLLCHEKNPERELWEGFRLGPEAAPGVLGVDEAFASESLDQVVVDRLADQPAVWLPWRREGLQARFEGWIATLAGRSRSGVRPPRSQHDLTPLLAEMRLIKDATEIETMRRAATIAADGHVRAMRFCAARFRAEPNGRVREYEIEAELLHEFRRRGAQGPAYGTIVAAGANARILHHPAGSTELEAGQLCLVDAGCELDGYASDITRTFPANGRFSAAQGELYEWVHAAQAAAIGATRPGARQRDAHDAAVRVLAEGLLASRLLDPDEVGGVDDVVESAAYRAFFMHGTGHWLGRDVHDAGEYLSLDEPAVEQADGLGGRVVRRPSRVLQPGMVVTLEPGLYVRPAEGVPERFWDIGIRIEDDAVVTATGCELLSRGVPAAAAEIERLMGD